MQLAKTGCIIEVVTEDDQCFWWDTKRRKSQWNFEALELGDDRPGPKHPASWVPDDELTRLMDLFYERNKPSAKATKAVVMQLETLFERMEDDLHEEEADDDDDDVLPVQYRWIARQEREKQDLGRERERDKEVARDASIVPNQLGHGLEWALRGRLTESSSCTQ